MATNFYYVYALKDPRSSPAKPFYIGKGTGSRAYDHLITPDQTRKYARIQEITASGGHPLVDVLVEDLTEVQALRLEAELIKAVVDLARANAQGITNSDAASLLGLRSDYLGRQKDYLSYSVLGLLLRERRVKRSDTTPPRHVVER